MCIPVDICLVIALIFDNKETFKDLNRKECKNILYTFRKEIIKTNRNIIHIAITYNCEDLFHKLKKNIIRYICAKNKRITRKLDIYMKREKKIVSKALSYSYADCLKMFLLSEYKEYIHDNMFSPYHKDIDDDILNELERIVHNLYGFDDVYNYRHNPEHFLFKNKLYAYHEAFESKGINIMNSWEDELASFSE